MDYARYYGELYKDGMDIKDIAKEVRKILKTEIPGFKFSVKIKRYSGGESMNISLTEAPKDFCFARANPDVWRASFCPVVYSEALSNILNKAKKIGNLFNYDGSDIMVDYFDVNYYCFASVGFRSPADIEKDAEEAKIKEKMKEAA